MLNTAENALRIVVEAPKTITQNRARTKYRGTWRGSSHTSTRIVVTVVLPSRGN